MNTPSLLKIRMDSSHEIFSVLFSMFLLSGSLSKALSLNPLTIVSLVLQPEAKSNRIKAKAALKMQCCTLGNIVTSFGKTFANYETNFCQTCADYQRGLAAVGNIFNSGHKVGGN